MAEVTIKVSVLVPTHRRVRELRRCLEALKKQSLPAEEVIVVVRDEDDETRLFLQGYDLRRLCGRSVIVRRAGVVAAMNAGLAVAGGDVIALLDDDAAPRFDWLARIRGHFAAREKVGGVGGRDRIPGEDRPNGACPVVGVVQWWGRVIGNHHAGAGAPRAVHVLKGVNFAYRAEPLRRIGFDERLLGSGAQVHWELSLGLALKRNGWTLVYDPAVMVDHCPARRFDEDRRNQFHPEAHRNTVHNETLVLLEHFPPLQRLAFVTWAALIGTRNAPGIFVLPLLAAGREPDVFRRWAATAAGRFMGFRAFRRQRWSP